MTRRSDRSDEHGGDPPADPADDIHDAFRQFESDFELFERTAGGIHYWEWIRFQIHERILLGSDYWEGTHNKVEFTSRNYARGAAMAATNVFKRNPLLAPSADLLAFGHQRRKQQTDGTWWDIYSDPVLEAFPGSHVLVEKPYQGDTFTHFRPAKTPNIRHLDFVEGIRIAGRKLGLSSVSLSAEEQHSLEAVTEGLTRRFGVRVDIRAAVEDLLTDRRATLPLYERIVDRVDPDVAVVVVSYGKETFIEACQRRGVPVVELQHGAVTPNHFGYVYPNDRRKKTFPDYFFSFGHFWRDHFEYPISDERVLSVGYPYLEAQSRQYADVHAGETVLFISQPTVGESLSSLAVELADRTDDSEVVYKLHPSEYTGWEETYPGLANADLQVVDSDDPPLYELLASARVQVGINSTVLFEGLNFDLETYLVDLPGIEDMEWLFEEGLAMRAESAVELATYLAADGGQTAPDPERFFEPDATKNAVEALAAIAEGRSLDAWR